MNESRIDMDTLVQENKALKQTLNTLLDELDASNTTVDTDAIRDELPDQASITPPWDRQGYQSKQAWLEDR